jgi:hypothetical protein
MAGATDVMGIDSLFSRSERDRSAGHRAAKAGDDRPSKNSLDSRSAMD